MASTSSTEKQQTNATQRRQTTSSKANPLDLTRLLPNDERRKVFTKYFLQSLSLLLSYITTRMEALDVANQQIQVELRCLSNQLDYMDLDDENAEPESWNHFLGFAYVYQLFDVFLCLTLNGLFGCSGWYCL
ncbi:hypothetical protein Lal_00000859 [Lupinus albus]|nr:hypothetical protein Lal_00000859 [Lupinus albus]